ncbi:hypothetical protein SERLA73DRAFT_162550 [Serpula lacrymans var. lacrymans S7.3]|uniref:RING-type E3 ubiquitin transferase n=1 Tax=Serpula lacrymans var. lacrymans (strain S7.3) TaxID=936435 RepID=F8Q8E8_SERL3|nr:hypothetical protein SERLA73DRAFT_162550 [Serpula lacrymans var. lacrymans S7.3]
MISVLLKKTMNRMRPTSQRNMAAISQPQPRSAGQRGKRGSRGRGGYRGSPRNAAPQGNRAVDSRNLAPKMPESDKDTPEQKSKAASNVSTALAPVDDVAVCWICAEPVKYYSVSACNHRTCHVCALRLRALYKKLDCTFCKEPQPNAIFTVSPDALFSSYTPESIPHKDSKLSIFFETEDMMAETLILLRFNCPDPDCDYTGTGWGDLKLHVRALHGKVICDLCIRFKKVFAHEHALYLPNVLPLHLPSMPHRSHKQMPKEQIDGGTHPLCEFCRECFFSEDELYAHMRERHEECFVCKRNEVRDQYFQNYDSLERHFTNAHFACNQPQCLAQKFVVFGSAMDLKAHMVEVHGADMTARDKKDAMRIQAEFEFEDVGGSGRRGRRDRDREREREPPQGSGLAVAQPRANGRRREAFGGHLTVEGTADGCPNTSSGPSHRATPSPPDDEVDPMVAQRHAAFMARLRSLAPNPITATPAVKAAVRGYRLSESSARDLISTIWNVLDNNLDDTASIVNGIVDLLDEEEKKTALLSSWNGFKIEQRRQFPDLVPTAVGSQYAGITGGRVLNAKHATTSRSSNQSSRQVWDRVAQAAGSSTSSHGLAPSPAPAPRPPDRFPALQMNPSVGVGFRQGQRNTPWSASNSSGVRAPSSVPAPAVTVHKAAAARAPPSLSKNAFPELPTSTSTRVKPSVSGNQSLRNILGDTTTITSAWKPGNNGVSAVQEESIATGDGAVGDISSGKGRKGKGKQKQTLFTLGTFPT